MLEKAWILVMDYLCIDSSRHALLTQLADSAVRHAHTRSGSTSSFSLPLTTVNNPTSSRSVE